MIFVWIGIGVILGILLPYLIGTVMSFYRIFRFTFRNFSKRPWKYKHKILWERFTWALGWEIKGAEVQ